MGVRHKAILNRTHCQSFMLPSIPVGSERLNRQTESFDAVSALKKRKKIIIKQISV